MNKPIPGQLSCFLCYNTALYVVESPATTWVLPFIGIVFVVLGRRILGGKPGVSQKGMSVVSVSVVHEGSKLLFYLYANNNVSTTEYRLKTQTCPGIQSVPPSVILTSGVCWLRTFCFSVSICFLFVTVFLSLCFFSRVSLLHPLHDGDS